MKILTLLNLLFIPLSLFAQPDTEVYLVDIDRSGQKIQLTNPRNISNNVGYDNQPYFYDESSIMFASTRSGQTDILKFNILDGSTSTWLTDTPTGSEFSPLRMPESTAISAIRLDLNGLQRLYAYAIKDGSSQVILKGAKIGYHLWYSTDILVATLLTENRMDLILSYLTEDGKYQTIQKNVGRSLQKNSKYRTCWLRQQGTQGQLGVEITAPHHGSYRKNNRFRKFRRYMLATQWHATCRKGQESLQIPSRNR